MLLTSLGRRDSKMKWNPFGSPLKFDQHNRRFKDGSEQHFKYIYTHIYNQSSYLECGSKCLTSPETLGITASTGDWSAVEGDVRFSSLHRKQAMSTRETFPTHLQSASLEEWLQLQTLTQPSPDFRRAAIASATVAETNRHLSGGFPRQRSDTSFAKNLTAMQWRVELAELKIEIQRRKQGIFLEGSDFWGFKGKIASDGRGGRNRWGLFIDGRSPEWPVSCLSFLY